LYSGIDISYRFRYTFPGFLAADGDATALTQSSAASTVPGSSIVMGGSVQVVWEKFANYWDAPVVRHADGEPDLLYIDLHLVHEGTSPQVFDASGWPAARSITRT
jgi:hypothetical protein